MTKRIQKQLEAVSATVSKIGCLYDKWAHRNNVNPYVLQVLCALLVKGPLTQKRIREMCGIPKQTVNKGITQLKQRNYVTLQEGETDKREKVIALTKSGEKYFRELLTPLFELEEKVVRRMGAELFRQLFVASKAFSDALELEMELEEVAARWNDKHQEIR